MMNTSYSIPDTETNLFPFWSVPHKRYSRTICISYSAMCSGMILLEQGPDNPSGGPFQPLPLRDFVFHSLPTQPQSTKELSVCNLNRTMFFLSS